MNKYLVTVGCYQIVGRFSVYIYNTGIKKVGVNPTDKPHAHFHIYFSDLDAKSVFYNFYGVKEMMKMAL